GNSGGPLLDQEGKGIGINTAGLVGTSDQPAQGINFAISVQTTQPVAQALIKGTKISRGYLGVAVTGIGQQGPRGSNLPGRQGAVIEQVSSGSPAAQAGLQSGDIIVKLGDVKITSPGDLTTALTQYPAGSKVTVTFYRGSSQQTAQVTLGQRP